jgi:hypothetical protein
LLPSFVKRGWGRFAGNQILLDLPLIKGKWPSRLLKKRFDTFSLREKVRKAYPGACPAKRFGYEAHWV